MNIFKSTFIALSVLCAINVLINSAFLTGALVLSAINFMSWIFFCKKITEAKYDISLLLLAITKVNFFVAVILYNYTFADYSPVGLLGLSFPAIIPIVVGLTYKERENICQKNQ